MAINRHRSTDDDDSEMRSVTLMSLHSTVYRTRLHPTWADLLCSLKTSRPSQSSPWASRLVSTKVISGSLVHADSHPPLVWYRGSYQEDGCSFAPSLIYPDVGRGSQFVVSSCCCCCYCCCGYGMKACAQACNPQKKKEGSSM
ncbi:hypothetical protein COCMIDRAFT_25143 [Bipolaris oryzae ATCC 44560]|uniref:Uncharacterized protein n=1 Tax=Bipolaris oryzae ATCC 44560 TaxID=930090 RepID=W6ZHR1_COCMI|nr:uncharacterized protein COCMIDRAFT_25143 [Bipolaris oryzae ATCC 44560]EUC46944.1 hypothetical protein COCMIDRAFT_25143 [Bipolaris oryzae ATCC 44560]